MRVAPAVKTATSFAWNKVLLGLVVVVMAMVALALFAEAMSSGEGTVYLANISPQTQINPSGPSIVVTGRGRATAPPERATLQLLITSTEDYFVGGARPASSPSPENEDLARVAPIVNAISALGIGQDAIAVAVSPAIAGSSCYGPPGMCLSARIDVTIDQPDRDRLNAIVEAADAAGSESALGVVRVGAAYHVADCAPLERAAREQATADAHRRARDQAGVLGVELGALLMSSEQNSFEAANSGTCGQSRAPGPLDPFLASEVGLSAPAFDPTAAPEAVAVVEVSLAFAIPQPEDA